MEDTLPLSEGWRLSQFYLLTAFRHTPESLSWLVQTNKKACYLGGDTRLSTANHRKLLAFRSRTKHGHQIVGDKRLQQTAL